MCARDQGEVVLVVEMLYDFAAKEEASAARGEAPAVDLVGVGPEEIAHGTFVRDFLFAVQEADAVDCVEERGETAMNAEDSAAGGGTGGICGAAGGARAWETGF